MLQKSLETWIKSKTNVKICNIYKGFQVTDELYLWIDLGERTITGFV